MKIKDVINYRSVWMGLAMLWVMAFHSALFFDNETLDFIKAIGYGGVDIFFFAAGVGNFFSYLRDENPLEFLKRRLCRLAPVYVPFICIWMIYKRYTSSWDNRFIIGNIFGVQGFSSQGDYYNWYISAILLFYILTPYLSTFIKKASLFKNIILVLLIIALTSGFWLDGLYLISVVRLPIFVIGMIIAKYSESAIKLQHILIGIVTFVLGTYALYYSFQNLEDYLRGYALYWYPFILIVPFLCYLISMISKALDKNSITHYIVVAFSKIGEYSFELFLLHLCLFDYVCSRNTIYPVTERSFWGIMFIVTFIFGFALRLISLLVRKIFSYKRVQIN